MNEVLEQISKLNLDINSDTALAIADKYITYLYVEQGVAVTLVLSLTAVCAYAIKKLS